jgi:dTDP-4-amino-4,6-dideoxygalactose transaminase
MIPFSRPRIDQEVIDEVVATLQSGWITTGPRTKSFEEQLLRYCGCRAVVAVSSWTMGMQVFLHWWGIGPGDEVIVPAYTYCATANVIVRAGATPVMVDIAPADFNVSVDAIARAVTDRTKAVIAVDVAGMPCDYPAIHDAVASAGARRRFRPASARQESLGRVVVLGDAAHSLGATVGGTRTGALCDVTCFSFHAVKNLTTAEGGALCFNLPEPFDHPAIYREFCSLVLHGQDVDALAKTKRRSWRYDVEEPGFKCNMTDLQAALGLVELRRYQENLDRRREIFAAYDAALGAEAWALLPPHASGTRESSRHVYQLRVRGASEAQRDAMIQAIYDEGVAVNVHFIPLPLLTAYRKRGHDINDYPESWEKYHNEISLPVYCDLTDEQVRAVVEAVKSAVRAVLRAGSQGSA